MKNSVMESERLRLQNGLVAKQKWPNGNMLIRKVIALKWKAGKKMPTSLWIGPHLQMSNTDVIKQLALFLICFACHLEARSKTTGTVVTHLTFGRIMDTFWILKSAMPATAKWPVPSPTRYMYKYFLYIRKNRAGRKRDWWGGRKDKEKLGRI